MEKLYIQANSNQKKKDQKVHQAVQDSAAMTTENKIRHLIQAEFIKRCKKNNAYSLRAFAQFLEIDQSYLSEKTLNTILFYLEQNKKNQFNVESELKKFEYILLNPILLSQMMNQFELIEQYQLESIENMKVVNQQIEQRIQIIDQDINQLKNKIKEQEERKCPSNLL